MKYLIGKKITGLSVSADQSILSFTLEDGAAVNYFVSGDCCSESWFADITGVNALIGGTVATADEVDMECYNVDDGRTRQESDQAYGWKLTTNKGYVDIVFRNSSNGYYGGDMGEFSGQLPENMATIEDDWHA